MTKSEAGRMGGKTTASRYGREYMQAIGRRGAQAFYARYTLQPWGQQEWAIVERATNQIKAIRRG